MIVLCAKRLGGGCGHEFVTDYEMGKKGGVEMGSMYLRYNG